jgi:hypothetical protein
MPTLCNCGRRSPVPKSLLGCDSSGAKAWAAPGRPSVFPPQWRKVGGPGREFWLFDSNLPILPVIARVTPRIGRAATGQELALPARRPSVALRILPSQFRGFPTTAGAIQLQSLAGERPRRMLIPSCRKPSLSTPDHQAAQRGAPVPSPCVPRDAGWHPARRRSDRSAASAMTLAQHR